MGILHLLGQTLSDRFQVRQFSTSEEDRRRSTKPWKSRNWADGWAVNLSDFRLMKTSIAPRAKGILKDPQAFKANVIHVDLSTLHSPKYATVAF